MIDVPAGHEVFGEEGGFIHRNGPVVIDPNGGKPILRLRLGRQHTNRMGIASGGLMMMLLDITLGSNVSAALGYPKICPTVQLNCSFIRAAQIDEDVEGHAEVQETTRTLAFASGRLLAGGKLLATANGVFKIPSAARAGDEGGRPSEARNA